jgi:hypothetical protein
VTHHLTQDEIEQLAGAKGSAAASSLSAHIDACARCRGELQAWLQLDEGFTQLGRISPAPEFASHVMQRVRLPIAWHERALMFARRRWGTVLAAAAALALIVSGSAYWLFGAQGLRPSQLGTFLLDGTRDLAMSGMLALGRIAYDLGIVDAGSTVTDQVTTAQALGGLALAGTVGLLALFTMMRLMRPTSRLLQIEGHD